MTEWHVPFHVIENEWTERQFVMFVQSLMRRRKREEKQAKQSRSRKGKAAPQPYQ